MRKLAAWCHDRRRTVLGLWVGAFLLFAVLWGAAAGDFANNFKLPGTESQHAYDTLKDKFPSQSGDTASVVFSVKDGNVLDAANKPTIEAARKEISKSPEVLAVGDPFAEGAPVSQDGTITFATIQFKKGAGDFEDPNFQPKEKVQGALEAHDRSGTFELTGLYPLLVTVVILLGLPLYFFFQRRAGAGDAAAGPQP